MQGEVSAPCAQRNPLGSEQLRLQRPFPRAAQPQLLGVSHISNSGGQCGTAAGGAAPLPVQPPAGPASYWCARGHMAGGLPNQHCSIDVGAAHSGTPNGSALAAGAGRYAVGRLWIVLQDSAPGALLLPPARHRCPPPTLPFIGSRTPSVGSSPCLVFLFDCLSYYTTPRTPSVE